MVDKNPPTLLYTPAGQISHTRAPGHCEFPFRKSLIMCIYRKLSTIVPPIFMRMGIFGTIVRDCRGRFRRWTASGTPRGPTVLCSITWFNRLAQPAGIRSRSCAARVTRAGAQTGNRLQTRFQRTCCARFSAWVTRAPKHGLGRGKHSPEPWVARRSFLPSRMASAFSESDGAL